MATGGSKGWKGTADWNPPLLGGRVRWPKATHPREADTSSATLALFPAKLRNGAPLGITSNPCGFGTLNRGDKGTAMSHRGYREGLHELIPRWRDGYRRFQRMERHGGLESAAPWGDKGTAITDRGYRRRSRDESCSGLGPTWPWRQPFRAWASHRGW